MKTFTNGQMMTDNFNGTFVLLKTISFERELSTIELEAHEQNPFWGGKQTILVSILTAIVSTIKC